MTVHLLRRDQTYIGKPIALCGVVVDAYEAQLARGLRVTCADCTRIDREDDDAIQQLLNEPSHGEPSHGETGQGETG